jgi:polar amino acid transport system substrate-binding protein
MYPTAERAKQVNFVVKSIDGQGLLVKKGNPEKITGFNKSLSGKRLGMITGYSTIPGVKERCAKMRAAGGEPCKIVLFTDNAGNVSALRGGKVDALVDSITAVGWYTKLDPNAFEVVKSAGVFLKSNVAFAVRKDSTDLRRALTQAVARLYKSGYMCQNFKKWNIPTSSIPRYPCK